MQGQYSSSWLGEILRVVPPDGLQTRPDTVCQPLELVTQNLWEKQEYWWPKFVIFKKNMTKSKVNWIIDQQRDFWWKSYFRDFDKQEFCYLHKRWKYFGIGWVFPQIEKWILNFLWKRRKFIIRKYSGCIINATNWISRGNLCWDLKNNFPQTSKKHLVPYATNMEIIKIWW